MISVEEAKNIIQQQVVTLDPVTQPLVESAGSLLAENVFATVDIPAFAQSSMDGYAFSFSGWQSGTTLQVAGEVAAGSDQTVPFSPGQAVRIFTGAPVPDGADTVVMQENVTVTQGKLSIQNEKLSAGGNVRLKGSEIKAGAIALEAGTNLTPAAMGFLAGIGVTQVTVFPQPIVSIIVTGRELQQPGKPLQRGQVYESNSLALKAALKQLFINEVKVHWADDELEILKAILQSALDESDVVLLTGGVSVGDYDFVLEAATQCGVTQLFHRIKQRPGKPLYFGKKDNKLVFGLPGNPSSVLTCFYEYVLPALQQLANQKPGLNLLNAPLAKAVEKPTGLTHFLKGFYDGQSVTVLEAQESYRLSSFARANCLVKIDEATTHCAAGEKVEIHLLN
ncbi:MAG: molybdopterin molybdochelatase [Ferruginibacter sp.]|nr:molybdopterin molybdochelatase [Ferruginibacter sp.]